MLITYNTTTLFTNLLVDSCRTIQESPADAVEPAQRKSMPKLLQFDVFRFI